MPEIVDEVNGIEFIAITNIEKESSPFPLWPSAKEHYPRRFFVINLQSRCITMMPKGRSDCGCICVTVRNGNYIVCEPKKRTIETLKP